jgi:hypothetical protein
MVAWAWASSSTYKGNMKSLGGLVRNSLAKKGKKPLQLEKQKYYDLEINKRKIEKEN